MFGGKNGHPGEFLTGMDCPGGIVRVAEQENCPPATLSGSLECGIQGLQVQPASSGQWSFHDSALGAAAETVKWRVDRRRHDHPVSRFSEQPDDFGHPAHHVGDARSAFDIKVPAPACSSESAGCFGERSAGCVAGVASPNRVVYRVRDRRSEAHVQLRDPERQDIGGEGLPFPARPSAQLLEGKFSQRVPHRTEASHLSRPTVAKAAATASRSGPDSGRTGA